MVFYAPFRACLGWQIRRYLIPWCTVNRRQLCPDYCGSRGPFIQKMKTSCDLLDRLHDVQLLSWYCIYHNQVKGLQKLLMTETVELDGIMIVINRVLPWRLRQRTWRFEFRQTSSNDTSAATSESCYKQQDTFHTLLCHGDVSPVQMLWHDNVTLFVKVRQQSDFWREDFFIQPIWFGPIWQLDLSEWQMKSAWQTKQVFVMRISLLFLNF